MPGLRMLCGSSRVLTPRISPMSGGLFDMCRNCGFIAPSLFV